MKPTNQTAIITGASRGIGAVLAKRLAKDGFDVVVNYTASQAAAEAVVADIVAMGAKAIAVQADITQSRDVARLFDAAQQLGPLGAVVCNAGILELAPMSEFSDEAFARLMAVNLTGAFYTLKEAARRLDKGGRIVALSTSINGSYFPSYGPYAASKAAVEAMCKVLCKELAGRDISVNVVAPGPIATEFFMEGKSDELVARIAGMNPYGRLGQPEDITDVVSYLLSPAAVWVNGQVLKVNGGMVI